MSRATTPLEKQLNETRWRLFGQNLLENLAAGWLAALVLVGLWFLLQPWIVPSAPTAGREIVLYTLMGLGTAFALVRTWQQRITPVLAALEVDARYQLKERVVTGYLLSPEEANTSAGQALLADVNQRVQPLRMSEQFPLQLPTTTWFLPVGLLVVVLLLLLYRPQPFMSVAGAEDRPLGIDAEMKKQLDEKKKELQQKKQPEKQREKASPELQKIRDQGDQIAKRSTETREQARDALQEIGEAEEQIQKRQQDLQRKQEAFQKQLDAVAQEREKQEPRTPERLKRKNPKENPAADLDKAMKQADFDQARDEADRLFKRVDPDAARQRDQREADIARREGELERELDRPETTPEEKEKLKQEQEKLKQEKQDLADQKMTEEQRKELSQSLKEMAQDLKAMADEQDKKRQELDKQKKDLEDKQAQAKTPEEKEQLQKQLDQVKQQCEECMGGDGTKDARDLAKKLEEAKEALEKGNDAEAGKKLREAANQMAKMGAGEEKQELANQKGKLGQARKALAMALDADGQGQQGNRPGQGGPNSRPGAGGPATGARPESKTGETKEKEERSRSQLGKGKQSILDFVPGEGLKEPFNPGSHVDVVRQAAQEAPEALDRQQLPRGASEMVRGYFEKFRAPKK